MDDRLTTEYQTKTSLILPFKGIWIVGNGGRTPDTNNHIRPADKGPQNQIFAYDFKKNHKGDGKKLEDYEAFGAEVIAPADGTIIQIIVGAVDIPIGERDRSVGVGNATVIDHHNGEYSLLCHFKHNSIKVDVGDKVEKGDLIGLCGNTGNTSEPHIHFNLQDGPWMYKANGLAAQFKEIKIDLKITLNCELLRGQRVSNI